MSDARSDTARRLILRLPKRRRVFEAVVACPGTHARRLSRDLGIALGVVEHHVRHLEKHGLLYAHQQGRRRTLYGSHVDPEDARIIHALRKPVPCALLAALGTGERAVTGLALQTGLPASMVSYNLRRLRALGLVEHVRAGREGAYFVLDPKRVAALLRVLRPHGAPDAALSGLVERALAIPRPLPPTVLVPFVQD